MKKVDIYQNILELSTAAAVTFNQLANNAIINQGRFSVVLAGGGTPSHLYRLLAENKDIDWSLVHFFWGDERCVPPQHPDSNFRMAYDTMIKHLPVPEENINRIKGELKPSAAAAAYREVITTFHGDKPRFNLFLLGLGSDGHTASLFPGINLNYDKGLWVVANYVNKLNSWRISLTPEIINQAEQIIFMVSGEDKASTLAEVVEGKYKPETYPAQLIQPKSGSLTWMIDKAAAEYLENEG